MKNANSQKNQSSPLSGAKGSGAGVQAANGNMEEMLAQLHQVLGQVTQSLDSNSPANSTDSSSNKQITELTNQLATNLQKQGKDAGESAMQDVLEIMDTLSDMLDNGQIAVSKS